MVFDRADADREFVGDLAAGLVVRDQPEHLSLRGRQRFDAVNGFGFRGSFQEVGGHRCAGVDLPLRHRVQAVDDVDASAVLQDVPAYPELDDVEGIEWD